MIVGLKFEMFEEAGRVHVLSHGFRETVLMDYQRLYSAGEATHFVAVENNEIVGMAGAFLKADLPYRYFKNPRYGFLGDLYTKPQARGRGLARELSRRVLEWCWSRGIDTVRLLASEDGRPLYRQLGFVPTEEMVLYRHGRPAPRAAAAPSPTRIQPNCFYCERIRQHQPDYPVQVAAFDIPSEAPRCPRHWRMICGRCGRAEHFMAVGYCTLGRLFCQACAAGAREVSAGFWGYQYYFTYQSPWTGEWCPALDRLEFEARYPFATPEAVGAVLSSEAHLIRAPRRPTQWRPVGEFSEADSRANWNTNAVRWDATYDDDGDRNRRYQSDEPMLALLGEVRGLTVLDVGSGNGYLCRKLARRGARMTGVELSDEFLRLARERERQESLGITYLQGSVARMEGLPSASFDKAVSNYVLMDVHDYEAAVREVFRALKRDGIFVVVISHPAFACGPGDWLRAAPDSPRPEDRTGFIVDNYFHRGPYLAVWGDLDPVLSFHRPLRDYWRAFQEAGFRVDEFEEPSLTERGRRELPPSVAERTLRVPWSSIFKLIKP